MKKLLLVFLLFQVVLFAQLNNTNKWIMRGDATVLTFASKEDLTGDTLIFVVKASKLITAVRLIEKTTYDSEITLSTGTRTFFYVNLLAGDTDDLTLAKYFYDITRINNGDTTTIVIGELNLQPDIGTPFDGTDLTGRVTTVSLNNGSTNRELIWWNDSLEYWEPSGVTFSAGGSVGNADSLGGVPASGYVDKTTAQTITGQKNFSGTVKFRSDSSITVGGTIGYPLGINFDLRTANSYQIPLRFTALDANTAAWTITNGEVDFAPSVVGKDHVFNIGNNWSSALQRPQFGQQMEANYEDTDTSTVYEWFSYYNSLPSPSTTYSVRPFQLGTFRYGTSAPYRYTSSVSVSADVFSIVDEVNASLIEFRTQTYGATQTQSEKYYPGTLSNALGNSVMYLMDSLWIYHNINNFGWLYQKDSTGGAKSMMLIDEHNNLVLNPDTRFNSRIELVTPITGGLKWRNEADNDNITIDKESGSDKLVIGNINGVKVSNLNITNISLDTSGVNSTELYVDSLTGSLQYALPLNLVANGTFTNWTGTFRGAVPDDWTFASSPLDTTVIYIEQNPTGKVNYVWDGSHRNHYLLQATATIGLNYGYSFEVSAVTDSVIIYVAGNALGITTTGTYTGNVICAANEKYKILPYYGPGSITLDNMKLWEIGGEVDAPPYDVPVILDSLGNLIASVGSSSTGNPDSLGGQPASAYLLKSDSTIYLTPSDAASAYSTTSHTHIDFFDTLSYSINVPDTITTGTIALWKMPNDITITEIAACTDAYTTTFNIEERGETTPNSAGTDAMGSDLVADTNQEETSTFTNAIISKNNWLALTVSATGDVALLSITIRYIKTD